MYVSVQSYFKEEDVGKGANVAISGSVSVAMVEIEDKNKKVKTDTERNNRHCQHMMSFPLSPVDLSVQRAVSDSQTLASGSLERLSNLEMVTLRCQANSTYETESERTESSGFDQEKIIRGGIDNKEAFISSLTIQPTKTTQSFVFPETTGALPPEREPQPRTMRVRNINLTTGAYVPQSEKSFKMRTEVKLEVKGQTKKGPLPTPQLSVSTLKNSITVSMNTATNVHPTDTLDTANDTSRIESVEDSITAPSGSPQNLSGIMETSTSSTSFRKVKSKEKNKEFRATSRPTTPMQTQPVAVTQQIPFHQPGSPRVEASTALREREQEKIKDTDETSQIRREQKAPVNGESETNDCYSGAFAACSGRPTTAPSTQTHCKLKKESLFEAEVCIFSVLKYFFLPQIKMYVSHLFSMLIAPKNVKTMSKIIG